MVSIDNKFEYAVTGKGENPTEARKDAINNLSRPIDDQLENYEKLDIGNAEFIKEAGVWGVEIKVRYTPQGLGLSVLDSSSLEQLRTDGDSKAYAKRVEEEANAAWKMFCDGEERI
ncbi:hypothetical protein GOV03_04075 [Candidatus Woesearchaeota archaeon]|nr:hypothetical protein [Candidatus Woesearchaeota archaeon]